jgi:acyl-CoA synthetase (AMP-forming)/AMP-acid ligase II
MFETFSSLADAAPDAPALIDGATGEVTTRTALLARAEEVAERYVRAGHREGDTVAVQLPNSIEFVATFLAVLKLRLVMIPIDRDAPQTEVDRILRHFAIGRTNAALPPDARLIKLTSGSSGSPKGIVTTDANLLADCRNICSSMAITSTDVNLGAIPFSHSYGFSNLVMPLIVQGTPVVFTNDYLPQSLIELANHHRCTVAPLIPMVFAHLASAAHGTFDSVRTLISAGAPLPATTSRRFRERFGIDIHSFYGCSECGGIAYDRPGAAVERDTVGAPLEGVTLATRAARLIVRSESVAAGYLLDATRFEAIDEGAFVTDDLVELRDGEVALTGRASDVINTAGRKVNPREVEAVILQIDGVREAKVYGEDAGARGQVVVAVIVATPNVTREQVREFCRARMSPHKVPRIVKLIDEMPVDERGKVKRAALAAL